MSRVTNAVVSRARRKKTIKSVKGHWGRSSSCFRLAERAKDRAMQYQYAHRRLLKRDMRSLFISRINGYARLRGLSYSKLMHSLAKHELNRKMLALFAFESPEVLDQMLGIESQ